MRPIARQRRGRLAILTMLIACALAFLAIEAYVRLSLNHTDLLARTGKKPGAHPMADWAVLDAFSAYRGRPNHSDRRGKSINADGFVSTPDIRVDKAVDVLRVAFLGGSSVAGVGLADAETWPWKTAELLKQRMPRQKIEFINAAVNGYSTFESFGRLWSRLRFYEPDILVLYHGWNEMYYFNMADCIEKWRTRPDGSWNFDAPAPVLDCSREFRQPVVIYEPLWIDRLLWPSQLLTKLRVRWSEVTSEELGQIPQRTTMLPGRDQLHPDYDHSGLHVFRTNLVLIRETARVIGAELFVAKQATLITADLAEEERARVRYDFHGFDHNAHVDAFEEIYAIIDEEIDPRRVIDTTALSGVPEYFQDQVHATAEGAQRIAEIVAKRLIEELQTTEMRDATADF